LPQTKRFIVRTPLFPLYSKVRLLVQILDGVSKDAVWGMIKALFDQTGTPQSNVDWSRPDEWIDQRLQGPNRELAKKIWADMVWDQKIMLQNEVKILKERFKKELAENEETFQPYLRDENLVRAWAVPGFADLEHRVGGLEKQNITGNVSYDPDNHQLMVKIRQEKVDLIANDIPEQKIDNGAENGKVLVLGWGSTYGAIKSAVAELVAEGESVSHIHLRYVRPFPKNLGELIKNFEKVLVPELNNGQLVKIIRDQFLVDAKGFNKIKGIPFTKAELVDEIKKML